MEDHGLPPPVFATPLRTTHADRKSHGEEVAGRQSQGPVWLDGRARDRDGWQAEAETGVAGRQSHGPGCQAEPGAGVARWMSQGPRWLASRARHLGGGLEQPRSGWPEHPRMGDSLSQAS